MSHIGPEGHLIDTLRDTDPGRITHKSAGDKILYRLRLNGIVHAIFS